MPLEESDLDRIADKIELSVTKAIGAAMDKHYHDVHVPCDANCDKRMSKLEDSAQAMNARLAWGMGAIAGLAVAWEFIKKKLGV